MTENAVLAPLVRVVLVGLSGLLHDIVTGAVDQQRDMELVAEIGDPSTLDATLDRTAADVAIWQVTGRGELVRVARIFGSHPALKVLTVEDDGRTGSLWELHPRMTALGEMSPGRLIETIRRVARP